MSSRDAGQPKISSPNYPAVDRSYEWEANYRRRARAMNRDYVNPNSTRVAHQRSLQSNTGNQARAIKINQQAKGPRNNQNRGMSNSNIAVDTPNVNLSEHRAQRLNMFYPTDDEVRARVTYGTQYPSQLPKPMTESSYPDQYHTMGSFPRRRPTPATPRTSAGIVDPYASEPMQASPSRHDYEYLKNSLIMFGEEASMGTGLSEQELLQRKRKEDTKAKFKAKKYHSSRIVNLPSSLMGRQQQLERRKQGHAERSSTSPLTVEREYEPPPPQIGVKRRPDDPNVNPRMNIASQGPTAYKSLPKPHQQNSASNGSAPHERRWQIIPSLSRSRSRSQSPESNSGAFPVASRRDLTPATEGQPEQKFRSAGSEDVSYFKEMDKKPSVDPPSLRKQPIMDYDYSIDDSAGWNDESALIANAALPPMSETSTRSEVGGTEPLYGIQEEWPDPGMMPELDEPEDTGVQESYGRSLNGHERPGYNRKGQTTPSQRAPLSLPTIAAASTTYHNDGSSTFDPFQGPDPFATQTPTHKFPGSTRMTTSRTTRGEISRSIDHLLAATASSPPSHLPYIKNTTHAPAALLNNPSGLNMEEFIPHKPDAPAAAPSTPYGAKNSQKKTSPTSVMGLSPNVRWCDDLEQQPTPRRSVVHRPKSILRSNRTWSSPVTNGTDPRAHTMTRHAEPYEEPVAKGQYIADNPSDIGFVGDDGRSLSPIDSFDVERDEFQPGLIGSNASVFSRNIPSEFQQAFMGVSADRFEGSPLAYSDFIEAVACVVIQTAIRRFLARARVEKLHAQRRRSEHTSSNRRALKEKAAALKSRNSRLTEKRQTSMDLSQLDMFVLAATRIQAVFRGWHLRDCVAIDNYCATIIQRVYRGHRLKNQFATLLYCVVTLQAAFRGIRVRSYIQEKVMHDRQESDWALSTGTSRAPQLSTRSVIATGGLGRHSHAIEHLAASIIQSCARGWITRRVVCFWLRSSGYETTYLFKSKGTSNHPSRTKGPSSSYIFSEKDSVHRLSTKQNVSSAVRSSISERQMDENSTNGPELEAYGKKIDEEMAELAKRDQRKGLIKARTNGYLQTSVEPVTFQAGQSPQYIDEGRSSDISANGVSSRQRGARQYRAIVRAESEDVATSHQHPAPTQITAQSKSFDDGAKSGDAAPKSSQPIDIDSSTCARPSNVLAAWKKRADASTGDVSPANNTNGPSESFQRHIGGASKTKTVKPAWWVKLEKNKAQDGMSKSEAAASNERLGTTESSVAPDFSKATDWKARLRKVDSHNKSMIDNSGREREAIISNIPVNRPESVEAKSSIPETKRPSPFILEEENEIESEVEVTGKAVTGEVPSNNDITTAYQEREREETTSSNELGNPDVNETADSCVTPMVTKPKTQEPSATQTAQTLAPVQQEVAVVRTIPKPVPSSQFSGQLEPTKRSILHSKAPIHVEMRNMRSESEQQRIDGIHNIFLRNGLIGRQAKESVSFADTSAAQYQANHDRNVGPAASDLIHAWKGSDQTQPVMLGKLF